MGLALARVLHAIAKRTRNARLRATADLALIRALNVCGEFKQALALCPDAARRFEKLGDTQNVARVWLEAAWAESYLGNLDDAQDYLAKVEAGEHAIANANARQAVRRKREWIIARLMRERGEYQAALQLFEKVRQEFSSARERVDAHRVLREIGHTQARLKPLEALPPLKTARRFFQSAGLSIQVAHCDYFLAQAEDDLNQFEKAFARLQETRRKFHHHGMDFFDASCALDLGYACWYLNRFEEMLAYSQDAYTLFSRLEAVQEASSCEVNIGYALMELNQYEQALPYFENARQMALATGRKKKAAVCSLSIGDVFMKKGAYGPALEHLKRARVEFAVAGVTKQLLDCDLHLGRTLYHLGQYDEALTVLERARALAHAEKMGMWQAICELYSAQVWIAKGKMRQATAASQRARRFFVQNDQVINTTLCDRIMVTAQRRDKQHALAQLERSRAVFKRHNRLVDVALCDLIRGELQLGWREWQAAQNSLQAARHVLQNGFPDQSARILYGLGRVAEGQAQLHRALDFYVQAAQTLAQLRGSLELESLSNSFFGARQRVIQDGLRYARQQQSPDHALAIIEASKAQTFLRLLNTPAWRLEQADEHLRALQERERALYYHLVQQRQRLVAQVHAEDAQVIRGKRTGSSSHPELRKLQALAQEYETVVHDLRLARRSFAGVPELDPFSLDEFRAAAHKQWNDEWLALNYYLDRNWLYIVCIDRSRVTLHAQPWTWRDQQMLEQCTHLHSDMRELVYGGTLRGQAVPHSENRLRYLGNKLLPPGVQNLSESSTLLIVPHGLLHQLAFAALQTNGEFLATRTTVVYSPNLQSFTQLCQDAACSFVDKALVFGVRDFDGRASELPYTHREVNQIRRLNPSATVLWQDQATSERLMEWNKTGQLRDFSILHFATHAMVDLDSPHLSHILFGKEDLTVLDIAQLALNARLITLSACSSNIGKGGSGDEWISLARAFFYAGARAIVASLWAVQDESTTRLVTHFYRNLFKGEPIAHALRNAQLKLHAEGYSPFQWAPFVAIGNV